MNIKKMNFCEEKDPIENVKKSLAYCFSDEMFANNYVDAVIELAVKVITEKPKRFSLSEIVSPIIDEILSIVCQCEMATIFYNRHLDSASLKKFSLKKTESTTFSGWPYVSEFNIKLGLEKIEEFIQSWPMSKEWMISTEFLGFESEESSNYFIYEVEFSCPTAIYPIPQATASIYFSVEVSKIIPSPYDAPVQVTYVYETCNIIHSPGRIDFHEFWMKDLLQRKLNFFSTVTF